jgi:predicted RNA binding protein YcfA (HicA-like mRNA interferase family)
VVSGKDLVKILTKRGGSASECSGRRGASHVTLTNDVSFIVVPLHPELDLESRGWERIERHPFSKTRKDSAAANGTDWLMRDPDGNMVLVEMKWFEDRRNGIRKAASQVEDDFHANKDNSSLNLKAAYIAIVEHDEENRDNKPMRIHVLRVVDKEGLK